MRYYSAISLIYSVLSFIALVHFLITSSSVTFVITILLAICSAETGIIAKIIEHKPKGDE